MELLPGYWERFTYADGTRVPLKAERCKSEQMFGPRTHLCKKHNTHVNHTDEHRCICGKAWS